jgi:hypothetical protein
MIASLSAARPAAPSITISIRFARQRQVEPSRALRCEPPIGTRLTLKISLETFVGLSVGHPLERQRMVNVLRQQIQRHCCVSTDELMSTQQHRLRSAEKFLMAGNERE